MGYTSTYDRRIHRVATVLMLLAYVFFAFGNIAVEALHRGIHAFAAQNHHHHHHGGVHSHAGHHHGALDALLQVFDSPTDQAPSKIAALPKPAVHLWLPWNWNMAFPWLFPVLHAHYLPVVDYRHPLRVPTPPPQRIS